MHAAASRPDMPTPHDESTSEPITIVDHEAALEKEEHDHQWQGTTHSPNPKDWSDKKKWTHILIVASMAMAT